jgi:hypothetical protein
MSDTLRYIESGPGALSPEQVTEVHERMHTVNVASLAVEAAFAAMFGEE